MTALCIKLPADLVTALDRQVARLAAEGGWPKPTRTDLIRNVLGEAAKAWADEPKGARR